MKKLLFALLLIILLLIILDLRIIDSFFDSPYRYSNIKNFVCESIYQKEYRVMECTATSDAVGGYQCFDKDFVEPCVRPWPS